MFYLQVIHNCTCSLVNNLNLGISLFSFMVASQSSIFMNWKSLQWNLKNYPLKILANFTDLAKCFTTSWVYCGAHHFCVIHIKRFYYIQIDIMVVIIINAWVFTPFFLFLIKRFCQRFMDWWHLPRTAYATL